LRTSRFCGSEASRRARGGSPADDAALFGTRSALVYDQAGHDLGRVVAQDALFFSLTVKASASARWAHASHQIPDALGEHGIAGESEIVGVARVGRASLARDGESACRAAGHLFEAPGWCRRPAQARGPVPRNSAGRVFHFAARAFGANERQDGCHGRRVAESLKDACGHVET